MDTLVSLDNGAIKGRKQSFAKFVDTKEKKKLLKQDL